MNNKRLASRRVLNPIGSLTPRGRASNRCDDRDHSPKAPAKRPVSQDTERAYPVDTSAALAMLVQKYADNSKALDVSFRQMVPWLKVGERATHYIHPYPAKLLPHIAHFFLAASSIVKPSDQVLDPFAGTGSVALETVLSGRRALYADVNPLARLIARVKTQPLVRGDSEAAFQTVQREFKRSRIRKTPDVVNLNRWFSSETVHELSRIKAAISTIEVSTIADLLRVTFSSTVRKVSLADPRFSVPVRRKIDTVTDNMPPPAWQVFQQQFESNLQRIDTLADLLKKTPIATSVGDDARALRTMDCIASPLPSGSVGLILTSPPYAGAQKYVRATSLSLGWLDLVATNQLRRLEDKTIGREHYLKKGTLALLKTDIDEADKVLRKVFVINPLRATIAANYLLEMRAALTEAVRVLRPGGYFVLVIGDNQVCGHTFKSSAYLCTILEQANLKVKVKLIDTILSRGLMTRRASTADVITREWIVLLQKPMD